MSGPSRLHSIPWLFRLILGVIVSSSVAAGEADRSARQWEPIDIELRAAESHPWWTFPVRATFRSEAGGEPLVIEAFANGGDRWIVRFSAPRAGTWNYRTVSSDTGLDGRVGRIVVGAPDASELERNPNLRGSIQIAPGGRHFAHADGGMFFLLADTLWAANTARCGLGEREDGPFYQYLADRKSKGFTTVLMQLFHGYGDYPDSPGHRNEGGYAFHERDPARLNPAHFDALDQRMRAVWERGLVAAVPVTWWGKTKQCVFKPADARRIAAYCAVRYGAFNVLWSLSGEYQYAFKDCGWTPADFTAIGETMQAHNPWRRPISIHPSSRIDLPAPHNVQSSRPFHGEPWIDHHWLQTGQSSDRLFNIVTRLRDNRALMPPAPVFCSEASYESVNYAEGAYHMRWQVWTAFLNGAAGYGYGAQGIWQFYDPTVGAEPGKKVNDVAPWREAIALPGSSQLQHARKLLTSIEWWKLIPQREQLAIDGTRNPLPTARDLSPPHAATIGDATAVIYVPRGNADRKISFSRPSQEAATARWFNPRTGDYEGDPMMVAPVRAWTIPSRLAPANEDWVLIISVAARGSGS